MSNNRFLDVSFFIDLKAEQAALQKQQNVLTTLAKAGIRTDQLNPESINALFITVRRYLEEVEVLTSIPHQLLTSFFTAAAKAGKMVSPQTLDASGLINVARWAKKRKGARCLQVAATTLLFEEQLRDREAAAKAIRLQYDPEIERLEKKIVELEKEMESEGKRIKKMYEPASLYKPLENPEEIGKLCYDKYLKECEEEKYEVESWSERLAATIEAKWTDAVRAEHMLEFVRRQENAEKLRAWMRTVGL